MLAQTIGCAVRGISGVPVAVEADVANGLPNFTIVGLTDRAIQEARDRVRTAIRNSGFDFPRHRVTVNLAPAELPKEGTGFDLAIAVAVLASVRAEFTPPLNTAFVAELALDGSARGVAGILPMARGLAAAGIRRLVVAADNAAEASRVDGLEIVAVNSFGRCIAHIEDGDPGEPIVADAAEAVAPEPVDLSVIRGQGQAKRALEIAAAGGHNVLMLGPPGSGKTMLAQAFTGLLPDLSVADSLDVASVYSLRRANTDRSPWSMRPPFRAPHHSISRAGLVGGGSGLAQPGEVSLASGGVLFLDEICEFGRPLIEALRQPLEARRISITRARGTVDLPARFTLIGAANPCPCGYAGDPVRACTCLPDALERYRSRVSGPVRDRIDLVLDVPRPPSATVLGSTSEESTAAVRARVESARALQRRRNGQPLNSDLDGTELVEASKCAVATMSKLISAADRLNLSARGLMRVLRTARTIADLADSSVVELPHINEALRFRTGGSHA